jgi:hypothetical protein
MFHRRWKQSVIRIIHYKLSAHKAAVCRNPHNSSQWRSRLTRQLRYKKAFHQSVVHTETFLSLYFCTNITCLNVGLLMIGQIFYVYCKIVHRWVTTDCCFMRDMFVTFFLSQISTYYNFTILVILTFKIIKEPREIRDCFWSFRWPQQCYQRWHCTSEGFGNKKRLLKEKFLENAISMDHNPWEAISFTANLEADQYSLA